MVVVLIEDIVAVNNLQEILAVDDIDCFMVVPGDLSQNMGYLGQATHPDVQGVIGKVIQQIVAAGKATGSTANDGNGEQLLDWGVQLFLTNIQGYVANGLRGFQQRIAAKAR